MAAGGYKEFVAGETLDQDEINDFLMQGMLVFAGTAARGSAIGTPVEGQFSFLKDSDSVEFFDGSDWVQLSTTPGAAVVSGTTGSPTLGTVSSGGTTYNVYSFTGSGSLIIDEAGFAELLVIGGGAAGGASRGGGGGAGGHLHIQSGYLLAGTATVTVGAGGAGVGGPVSSVGYTGNNGFASRIGSYFSPGGGGGGGITSPVGAGTFYSMPGLNGASGGGAGGFGTGSTSTGGSGFTDLGNDGGTAGAVGGGGGGGAGAAGGNGGATTGGTGGNGLANSITGTSVTRAGGGAGAGQSAAASGGTGGGGDGGFGGTQPTAGTANTGSGGGGLGDTGSGHNGNGGSGIVIVRVAI